jgi:Ca2+-binding RTX toxin-like protein
VAKNLNAIQGPVNLRGGGGGDGLEAYDQANAALATYTLGAAGSSSTLTRKGAAVVSADASVKTVILDGGSNNDTYKDQGTPPGTSVLVFGGSSQNTLVGPNANSTWEVALPGFGTIQGTAQNGPVSFTEMANLQGGSGDDTFRLDQNGNVPGTIDGGTGSNTLDYSAYPGNIIVDLLLKAATRVGGQVVNIQNVTGSAANGIIVGGGASGTLHGGTGRNLIIAGAGASQLYGGGNDDILIAGTTAYDGNLAALAMILAEWTQNTPVSLRIQHIKNGGGLNGAFYLTAGLNGTVVSNLQTNDLTDGTGTDWLFLRNGVDKQHKAKASDLITPL